MSDIGTPASRPITPQDRIGAPSDAISSGNRARRDRYFGMVAGVLAAIAMLVVVIAMRRLTAVASLVDALADALLLYLPISIFSLTLGVFGAQAKTLLLVGLFAGLLLAGAAIGRSYARRTAGARRIMWVRAISIGFTIFAVVTLFMLLYLSNRTPDAIAGGRLFQVLSQLGLASMVFAVTMAATLALLRGLGAEKSDPGVAVLSRRRFATRAGLAVASLGGMFVLGREVGRVAGRRIVGASDSGALSPAITPNDDFYVISKNFVDPDPDRGNDWSITIDGAVTKKLTLSRADLEAMPRQTFVSTLTCISNPVGGPLIGTAEWVGTSLAGILRTAGVSASAVKVILEGEDGYTDSIPIERALAPEPAVVWTMNNEPMPRLHGMPVRLIVPGLYGIKNVKWLTKITVSTEEYEGYWQQRSWTDTAIIKTSSRIDMPGERGVVASGMIDVGGVAFAGDRGIQAVEVSTDGGETWTEATIAENPSPGGLSWVVWTMDWVAKAGTYDLVVRAIDGTGERQTDEPAPELPDGASGWHRITVGVA